MGILAKLPFYVGAALALIRIDPKVRVTASSALVISFSLLVKAYISS